MSASKNKTIKENPLVIYKASAGSGKTYTLTLYYLWLLFSSENRDSHSPFGGNRSYRNILAVTFTNKATGEMKARIVKSLFEIASGGGNKGYINDLIATKCVENEQELRAKAKDVLYSLLHDYTNFNVSTIDAFFQKTMRSFVRDVGMQGGYNIELDSDAVAGEAIDRMYDSLSDTEKFDALKEWLLEYDMRQIEDGKNWNSAEKAIRKLSEELFSDEYRRRHKNIASKKEPTKAEITRFYDELTTIIKSFKRNYYNILKESSEILKGINLDELFYKSSSPLKYFISPPSTIKLPAEKLIGTTVDDWKQKKGVSEDTINKLTAFKNGAYIDKMFALIKSDYPQYCMALVLRSHLYSFGILSDIDSRIRDIVKERNIMLLPDTTELLSEIIEGNDTPFIYEKTGVNIHHFMIDEFQDTALSQWENFKPLLKESISKGGHNLIVGDVKQSIYRWRNSDWSLLNNLPESEDYLNESGAVSVSMKTNWRSVPNIIEFNNAFFEQAVAYLRKQNDNEILSQMVAKAYCNQAQTPSADKKENTGYVKAEFYDVPKGSHISEYSFEKLFEDIDTMLSAGCKAEDMAILVRVNNDAIMVAQYLMQRQCDAKNKYFVVSEEALLIKSSPIVRTIIAVMRYINTPEDEINNLLLNFECNMLQTDNISTAIGSAVDNRDTIMIDENNIKSFSSKSLYEMSEEIISLLNIRSNDSQMPYIQAFQDLLITYVAQHGSNLSQFLEWWDLKNDKLAISTPESANAIRIMTIHKSKGLEFSTVFIPVCDWAMDKGLDILWRDARIEKYEDWEIPLSAKSELLETDFAEDFKEEKALSVIDNLNLAYVAFTRAKHNLFIYSKTAKPNASSFICGLLYNIAANMTVVMGDRVKFDGNCFEFGKIYLPEKGAEQDKDVAKIDSYEVAPVSTKLKLRLKGKEYFDEHSKRSIGEIKHQIMSEIYYADDIERVISKYENMGILLQEEAEFFKRELLSQTENDKLISEWFSHKYKILNEASVLNSDMGNRRPDRVMIRGNKVVVVDYKFGEEQAVYKTQVKRYIDILKKMGYFDVEGYLWYVNKGMVQKI